MYNPYYMYQCIYPYWCNTSLYIPNNMCNFYTFNPCPYNFNVSMCNPNYQPNNYNSKDYGPNPFVVNIENATKKNNNYRTALWTGQHLQLTLMSIKVGEDIGLESHPNLDQFIRIEEGDGIVMMGNTKCNLTFEKKVSDDYAIFIPAGTWHNLINIGNKPIKLYSIYSPPEHPRGTIHKTKEIAEATEEKY